MGNTSQAFGELGIARFGGDCLVKLGRLKSHNERAVIRDWLEKGGHAKQDVTPWVDAIAQETDGWPQHIVCFAQPGSQVIQQSGGRLTDNGLEAVLEEGRSRKEIYYNSRTIGSLPQDLALLGLIISCSGKGKTWDPEQLYDAFSIRKRRSGITSADAINTLLDKGVLSETNKGYYVPIPSMERWLVDFSGAYAQDYPAVTQQLASGLSTVLQLQRTLTDFGTLER